MPFEKIQFRPIAVGILLTAVLSVQPVPAHAGGICKTPDGFSYVAATQNVPAAPKPNGKDKDGKGMGGTGITADRGMGGTGINIANGKGIGGTGIRFDEGIAVHGRITGFGSICVDGLEIKFSKTTPVQDGAQKMSAADLKVGQIVSVVAAPAEGALTARSIAVDRLVTGRLISIDTAHRTLNVAGQRVTVSNIEKVARSLTPGQSISVSGFKAGRNGIVATFIDRQPHASAASAPPALGEARNAAIQGFVAHKDAGGLVVDGTKVQVPDTARVIGGTRSGITENDRVIVIGRHEAGGITADVVAIENRDVPAELGEMGNSEVHLPHGGKGDTEKGKSGEEGESGSGKDGGGESGSGGEGSGDSGRDGGGFDRESGSGGGGDRPDIERHEGSGGRD